MVSVTLMISSAIMHMFLQFQKESVVLIVLLLEKGSVRINVSGGHVFQYFIMPFLALNLKRKKSTLLSLFKNLQI